jgi:putative flippase GtrA
MIKKLWGKGLGLARAAIASPSVMEKFWYLVFGGLTTAINIGTFYACNTLAGMDYRPANVVAWVVAVVFAYVTNRVVVFKSQNRGKGQVIREALAFFAARAASLLFDMGFMVAAVEWLRMDETVAKVLSNVFVVIINYVLSKFFVFSEKKG